MLLERALVTCAIWGIAICALILCRKQSPLHAMVLAVLASALVGTYFPVLSLFIPPATWRNISHLSHEALVAVQWEYAAWTAGLFAACLCASQMRWFDARSSVGAVAQRRNTRQRDSLVSWGLVGLGGALYALYLQQIGFAALTSREDYAAKYLLSTGLGPLQFGLSMMIVGCLWAEGSDLGRRDKRLFRVVGAAILVWSIAFISVRTYALLLVLGYAVIVCRRRRVELRRVHVGLIAGLVLGYIGLESFSLFRDLYRGDLGQALSAFAAQSESAFASVVGGSELSHPFVTTAEVMHDRLPGELAGSSPLNAVRTLMPLALDPDRPLTLSEKFVRSNYADFASQGVGTAFSLVAEAWLDFGSLIGPFALGAALGGLLLWMERRQAVRPDGLLARVAPYLAFFVAVEHRNELATLFKQVFMLALAVVPLCVAANAIRISLARRPRALAARSS